MNLESKGKEIVDVELTVDSEKLRDLERSIGTPSASRTASMVAFFSPTAAGESSVIDPLGLDLTKALQGGQSYEWNRPFLEGEKVRLRVRVEDVFDRGDMQIATVVATYESSAGELIQRQQTMFIERESTDA